MRRPLEVVARDDDDVGVAAQIEMLKPVVQHVDGAAEVLLGEAAGEVAARRDQHGDPVELPREHQRLVAGAIEIGADAVRIADDDDAVGRVAAAVAAAEDGRALAHVAQPRRDVARRAASCARPPTAMLPMLMTGRDSLRCRCGWRA